MPTKEEIESEIQRNKDAELIALANAAQGVQADPTGTPIPVQPGAGPNAQGIDLSKYDTPSQPANKNAPNPPTVPVAPDGSVIQAQGTTAKNEDVENAITDATSQPGPAIPTPVPSRPAGTPTEAGSVEALNQARKTGYAAADAKAAEAPAQLQRLDAEVAANTKAAEEERRQATEIETKQKAIEEGRANVDRIREAAYQDLKTFKPRDFWKDTTGWDSVKAKISVGLGELAKGLYYSKINNNSGLDAINAKIDRQHKQDEMEVRKKFDLAKLREQGAAQFETNMSNDLALLKFKQAATSRAVAKEIESQLIDAGIPLEQAKNHTEVLKFINKADQDDAAGYEKLMQVHGNLALTRAKLAQTQPDSPTIQKAIADYVAANPGDQAGAVAVAVKAGSKDPLKTVKSAMSEPDKIEAEKAKALAKVGNANAALRRERVAANIHEFNNNASKLRDDVITPEVLSTVQNNISEMHSVQDPHGAGSAVVGKILRGTGAIAKSPYSGLTDEQTEAVRALEATLQHGAEMQPTTGAEVSQKWKETYRPTPDMSQEQINKAIRSLKDMGGTFKSIIDPTNIGGRADKVDKEKSSTSTASKSIPPVGTVVTSGGKMYRITNENGDVEPVK